MKLNDCNIRKFLWIEDGVLNVRIERYDLLRETFYKLLVKHVHQYDYKFIFRNMSLKNANKTMAI